MTEALCPVSALGKGEVKRRVLDRTRNLVKFRLERLLLHGTGARLLLIACLLGLISVVAGLVVQGVDHGFEGAPEAVWWAFLRLTDPGYLGDDEGIARRLVSTIVTVLGYVLFLGALVAIMTQWLNQTLRDLESGFTPIAVNDHVLVVGNTSRTVTILRQMLQQGGRVRRFLDRHDASNLNLVLLADEVDPGLRYDLREQLGELYSDRRVILRSGTPLRIEHLRRVDFLNASVILLPSDDFAPSGAAVADTRTIKALLSMSRRDEDDDEQELPLVVAEILDQRKVQVAHHAYRGPVEIVASDLMVGCMLAQSVLFRGVSGVFGELLMKSDGNGLHIVYDETLLGTRYDELTPRFPHAVLLGFVQRRGKSYAPLLPPPADRKLLAGEALVVVAKSHEDALPEELASTVVESEVREEPPPPSAIHQRVLILGWSSHVPGLITELSVHPNVKMSLDIASVIPATARTQSLESYGEDLRNITLRQLETDFTVPAAMRRLDPASYDNVVIVASDWPESDEESDARSIVGFLLLQEVLRSVEVVPRVVVELSDPANARLFDRPHVDVLVTPMVVGQILAQVSLRPELRVVYEDLLGLRGAELASFEPNDFGIDLAEASFRQLAEKVALRSGVLVGLYSREAGRWRTHLNPPKASRWHLTEGIRLIVLNEPPG